MALPENGATVWRGYLMADGRMVAERTAPAYGTATMQYFVGDHLGSIAVSTDASGVVLRRMIYDPWGVQLDPGGAALCGAGTPTTRGYTGEEQFPVGCLVNLNARLYDPAPGRVLAGDPIISDDYDSQALDRYAYVHDNPLSLTDTDGRCGIFCFFIIDAIISVATVEVLGPVFARVPILGDLFIIADGIVCGPFGPLCAAEAAGSIAGVQSGSVGKGLEAFVFSLAEAGAFHEVGDALDLAKGAGLSGGA